MEHVGHQLKNFFEGLSFNEDSHSYYVANRKLSTSVSGIVNRFGKHTDFEQIASDKEQRLGVPPGSLQRLWDYKAEAAQALGNRVHYFGELYTFNRSLEPAYNQEIAIVRFFYDLPEYMVPVTTELRGYHKKYMYGGTVDLVLLNKQTGNLVIADYKTNQQSLTHSFGNNRMAPPFSDYLDTSLGHYQVQFSLYQLMIEQLNLRVEKRVLVHLKDDKSYEMYFTDDLTDRLTTYLDNNQL